MDMKSVKFTPKRGRPSSKQIQAIDEAILTTARRILLGEGYDSLTMDTIAAELGISKGTLYARHASKEALTQAVIRDTVEGWSTNSARNDHLLPSDLEPRLKQHLRTIGRKTADAEVQAYVRLWTSIQQRDPELARIFHDFGFLRGVSALAADIQLAGEREGKPPRDAEGAATVLLSALTGWYVQESAVREVSLDEIDATADRIVTLFMRGRDAW